jgi:hypothetical protein
MLTAVRKTDKRRGSKIIWEVLCSCGGSAEVSSGDLLRKDGRARVSCGCMNFRSGPKSANWKSPNEISMRYWNAVKSSATNRNLVFDISIDYAYKQFNGLCALTGQNIELNSTASIDRIDSAVGYIEGNIQWLHKDVNRLKSNWSQDRFIELCREVSKYAKQ